MVTGEVWRQAATISEQDLVHELDPGGEPNTSLENAARFAIDALHSAFEDSLRRRTFPRSENIMAGSVMVAMSGGVDSSAACLLMRDSGSEALGMTMRLWSDPDCSSAGANTCCSPQAIRDARSVCHSLGLPHLTVDYTEEFATTVVDPFVDGYLEGLTPNPCTQCNGLFRFPALVRLADHLGVAKVATGHYARLTEADGKLHIARAADSNKDQSYMLWAISAELLSRLEFPLGETLKDETRRIAREAGLAVHDRPESQEVCFIPDNDYRRFIRSRASDTGKAGLLPAEGEIISEDGALLGSHHGFMDFTTGQRHGLGVSAPEPLYVLRTEPAKNRVIAGVRSQLAVRHVDIDCINSFAGTSQFSAGGRITVQLRYNSQPAAVEGLDAIGDSLTIRLEEPAFGVAPGQSAVLYRDGVLLAGGIIRKTG